MKYGRKPIPGYEGLYEVDSEGAVWSLGRTIHRTSGLYKDEEDKSWHYTGKRLKPVVRSGKLGVRLHDSLGNDKQYSIGLLVANAFLGCPVIRNDKKAYEQYYVRNIDGDNTNNSAENLEWKVKYFSKNQT